MSQGCFNAAKTPSVAPNWYEQGDPNPMACMDAPRVHDEQLRVEIIAGTLQPIPIITLTKSRPVNPMGLINGCNAAVIRSSNPLAL